jgi:hypothetical protein
MGRSRRLNWGLRSYDSHSVILGAASLALWPANADRMVALDELAGAVLADTARTGRKAGDLEWRSWLGSAASRPVRMIVRNGICDSPPIVAGVVRGRSRLLIAGLLDAPDLQLDLWTSSLDAALCRTDDEEPSLALRVLGIAALISDRVVHLARLETQTWPNHQLDRRIVVPKAGQFERLGRALSFSADERHELGPAVEELITETGEYSDSRPLLADGGGFVVARPLRLLLAALGRARQLVQEGGAWDHVQAELAERAHKELTRAARDMDWQPRPAGAATVLAEVDRDLEAGLTAIVIAPRDGGSIVDGEPAIDEALRDLRESADNAPDLIFVCLVGDGRPVKFAQPRVAAGQTVLVLRLSDFRLLGDAFRRDPLGITRALSQLPTRWTQQAAIDLIGLERVIEDATLLDRFDDLDGVECLHRLARIMSARHPAPDPRDPDHWLAVSHWSGNGDESLFSSEEELGRFALLVRTDGSFIWVMAADPTVDRWDVAGQVCLTLAIWLGRLQKLGWRLLASDDEFMTRITVAFDPEMSAPISALPAQGGVDLRFGHAFVELASHGDNRADRLLLSCLFDHWGAGRANGTVAQLIDAIAPAGRGTLLLWPGPTITRNEPKLSAPRPVTNRELRVAEREVVAEVLKMGDSARAEITDSETGLATLIELVNRLIEDAIAQLDHGALLGLVELNERATALTHAEAVSLPARAQLPDGMQALGEQEASGLASVALRALIERVSARRPAGTRTLALGQELRLRALSQLLVSWGSTLEAVRTGEAECQIALSELWGVQMALDGPVADARNQATGQLIASAPERMAEEHSAWWGDPEPEPVIDLRQAIQPANRFWEDVDEAMAREWGFTLEQAMRLLRAAHTIADDRPSGAATLAREQLIDELGQATCLPVVVGSCLVDRLCLSEEPGYDALAAANRPWQTNRARSYLQRPFVDLGGGELCFSAQQLLLAAHFLYDLIAGGRLHCTGDLRQAVKRLAKDLDARFEDAVAVCCRSLDYEARVRVKKINGRRIESTPGQTLGDIDVLAWSRQKRHVMVLDSKRMAPGLLAISMLRQAAELDGMARRHGRRVEWVQANRGLLNAVVGDDVTDSWRIDGALILEQIIPGALIANLALPAWPIFDLPAHIVNQHANKGNP